MDITSMTLAMVIAEGLLARDDIAKSYATQDYHGEGATVAVETQGGKLYSVKVGPA